MLDMERQEYLQRLAAAYDAMDDRARRQQLRHFERAAKDYRRDGIVSVATMGRVVPFRRVGSR